jgi:D-lactate dehydrogenase (cytochrome)
MDPNANAELSALLGDRFVMSQAVRDQHGRDESPLPPAPPDAVAFANSEAEVSAIAAICNQHGVPLVPFGAGTSLEGHVLATSGGVALNLTALDQILEVNVDDLDAVVQAGVTRKQLDERLRREGLFFPVDPGADATLGGMAATGASGTTTVRYGAMRANILSLKVVLADGRIITTGGRARKSSAGYDLTRLFVGSEGTLGVITEVRLRVYGVPEAIRGAVCHFPTVDDAVNTVIATLQTAIPVARIELLDEASVDAVNRHAGLDHPLAPALFLEFHGTPSEVAEQTDNVRAIATEHGVLAFKTGMAEGERAALWRARHEHFYASLALRPGSRAITTDVCVPISRLAECILETKQDLADLSVTATTVGHVGDGNFHLMLLVDPDDDAEMKAAEELNERLVDRALAMGGTCTGEHGIGLRKIGSLRKEMGEGVDVMRSIKQALDPHNILNPGKVMSAQRSE